MKKLLSLLVVGLLVVSCSKKPKMVNATITVANDHITKAAGDRLLASDNPHVVVFVLKRSDDSCKGAWLTREYRIAKAEPLIIEESMRHEGEISFISTVGPMQMQMLPTEHFCAVVVDEDGGMNPFLYEKRAAYEGSEFTLTLTR